MIFEKFDMVYILIGLCVFIVSTVIGGYLWNYYLIKELKNIKDAIEDFKRR